MELGRNPAPLVLAETLIGLDDRLSLRRRDYKGCPRMLQLWLMERLCALASVDYDGPYRVGGVTTRALAWVGPNWRPKDYFARFVRTQPLRWVIPWWRISDFSANSVLDASGGLMLCGLELGVWIHPLRVRRQMGLAQVIPREDTRIQVSVVLTDKMVEDWAMRWANRATWRMPKVCETTRVSAAYARWTISKDSHERARLRGSETKDVFPKEFQPRCSKDVGPSRIPHAPILGKRKMSDGPSKGAPSSGSVFNRLGEASVSKTVVESTLPGVFSRLGDKGKMVDRLGDAQKHVVCGLRAQSDGKLKIGDPRQKYVVKSQVVV